MKTLLWIVLIAVVGVLAFGLWQNLRAPDTLYVFDGSLDGCPDRPSCVSSVADDDAHRVPGFVYSGQPQFAQALLRELIQRMGGQIAHESPNYLHAVFESPTFRLRDDLELLIQPEGEIDVRSASRFSWDDRGANRERVEGLRRSFEASP